MTNALSDDDTALEIVRLLEGRSIDEAVRVLNSVASLLQRSAVVFAKNIEIHIRKESAKEESRKIMAGEEQPFVREEKASGQ
jgi:hypothetical protein